MHEFSELVLSRMSLLVDQSRSVLPLRSAKAREYGELWREKCTRAPLNLSISTGQNQFFSAGQTGQMRARVYRNVPVCVWHVYSYRLVTVTQVSETHTSRASGTFMYYVQSWQNLTANAYTAKARGVTPILDLTGMLVVTFRG